MTTSKRLAPPRANRSSTSLAPAIPFPMTTRRSLLIDVDACGAHFEFRHAADRVERVVRHAIRRRLAGPVKWHEHSVWTDVFRNAADESRRASPRSKHNRRTVGEPVTSRQLRMHLGNRCRRGVQKLRDATRLSARLIVRDI